MTSGIGSRREARETALSILYEADVRGEAPGDVLARQVVAPTRYAADLVHGVDAHGDELDAAIAGTLRGWTLPRLPAIDRCVLRLAAYELAHRPDVPVTAIITEAVELASRYSTEDSGRFVNGVIATLAGRLRSGDGS